MSDNELADAVERKARAMKAFRVASDERDDAIAAAYADSDESIRVLARRLGLGKQAVFNALKRVRARKGESAPARGFVVDHT